MEGKKKKKLLLLGMTILVMLLMGSPALACSSNGGGRNNKKNKQNGCRDCVVDQMKYGCPSCVPLMRCMARCLWGGTSRSKCITRCDCNGGKPTLSDCKKCMSRCKCSCVA